MKLIVAWLAAFTLAAVTSASCSVPHKSTAYECATQADCADLPGRVCNGGYCVVTGTTGDAALPDAPKPPGDGAPDAPPNACPAQCTSCDLGQKTCKIDCAVTSCTTAEIVCPTGWNCSIGCSTPNSCRNGIDCTSAASCAIACTGSGSCRDLACGTGKCTVSCTGQNACRQVSCGDACACDVTCSNGASCEQVMCTSFGCGTLGGGCTSLRPGCNTCP